MNKKEMAGWLLVLFLLINFNVFLHAGDIPADVTPEMIAKGRELFHSKEGLKLKYACILCHQKEKAIEKSALSKLGDKLPAAINQHIIEKAKGKPISADSEEMKALMAYIRYEHSK